MEEFLPSLDLVIFAPRKDLTYTKELKDFKRRKWLGFKTS